MDMGGGRVRGGMASFREDIMGKGSAFFRQKGRGVPLFSAKEKENVDIWVILCTIGLRRHRNGIFFF
jgi:hypothetical protein